MTIALAMIAGGDDPVADGLEHVIGSARDHVDEVCLWANGPNADGVVALADRLNARPGARVVVERGEWADDFSAARNASFAMTGADWIVSLDCNDELVGGERLREVVARADAARADVAWAYWDRYANERYGWWPTVVRSGTGKWQGIVHECWRRPGIDRWRHGVGQPGSVHAHPAMLRVFHRDRATTPFKYLALLERAAKDPARTPWALAALAHEVGRLGDPARTLELLEAQLAGRWDDCEGTFNAHRAANLKDLAAVHEYHGNAVAAARYRAEWDAYTRKLTDSLGRHAAFLLQLGDEATVKRWASAPRDRVADVLLAPPPAPRPPTVKVGRNAPCPCGSGRKTKKCHTRLAA